MTFPPTSPDDFTTLREQLHSGEQVVDQSDPEQRALLDSYIVLFSKELEFWDEFDERVERLAGNSPSMPDDQAMLRLHFPVAQMRYHLATSQRVRGLEFAHRTIELRETSYAVHSAQSAIGTWQMRAGDFAHALLCLASATHEYRLGPPEEFVSGPICSLAANLSNRGVTHPAVSEALADYEASAATRAMEIGFDHPLSILDTHDSVVDWWLL